MLANAESPTPLFYDFDGDPLDSGSIYFGSVNQNPVTAQIPVFWDQAGTQPAAQPIRTLNGFPVRFGTPANVYISQSYSISVYDKKGRLVVTFPDASQFGSEIFKSDLAGAVGRPLRSKLGDVISVKDFGAIGNGTTDDTAAFNAAAAAVADDWSILVPPGRYLLTTVTSTKKLIWEAYGAFAPDGVTTLDLPGVILQSRGGAASGRLETMLKNGSTGTDFAVQHIERNATHVGGAAGYVNAGLRVDQNVSAGVTDFEWAIVGVIRNSATTGENVGIYGQGIKQSTGPTWGMVAEAIDSTGIPNPATGLIGIEVDISANGTDTNFNRIGVDVVTRRYNTSGATSEGGVGVRIGCGGSLIEGNWKTAIEIRDTVTVGIDMSNTAFTPGGYAIRLKTNAAIDMSGDGLQKFFWDGSKLKYTASTVEKFSVDVSGNMTLRGNFTMSGQNSTGAATPTLGANKPGANGTPATWLSFVISGTQYWVPAWGN